MSFYENDELIIDVWGNFAMFTRPESKVERVSYDCITPSAARGILNAIYSKPIEFYYQITKIEIMKPIKFINIKKNEFKEKTNEKTLEPSYNINEKGDHGLTQRNNYYLKDVYYRIYAKIIKRDDAPSSINLKSLYEQFERRVSNGKCFYQPSFGCRECLCHFSLPNESLKPIDLNLNLGIMLYDVFDITSNIPLNTKNNTGKTSISVFNAVIKKGTLIVPEYNSMEVFKTNNIVEEENYC